MRMNEILKTRFFRLMAEPSQEVTNEEMQSAFGVVKGLGIQWQIC